MRTRPPLPAADGERVAGVAISHPERVIFPESGITKAALAAYYRAVAERILPEVAERPLSLLRCPEGMASGCFFQKHFPTGMKGLRRITIAEQHGAGAYLVPRGVRDLLTLVQEGVVEIHPWGAKADDIERPDRLVLDLDPGPVVAWERVAAAAFALRRSLAERGLVAFVKTTGGKGLHVVAPFARGPSWSALKEFARAVAAELAEASPAQYTLHPRKRGREDKIFIDYLRNDRGATAVAAYSVRARAGATVATPVSWQELARGLGPASFTLLSVPRRLARQKSDPWSGINKLRQRLPVPAGKTG